MGGAIRRGAAALLSVGLGLLCALAAAEPAAAHNSLTGSDPKNGARLDRPPAQVRLTFLNRLDPKTTKVTVTGPDKASAAAGAPRFDGKVVEVDVAAGTAGVYTAAYEVRSDDGHPIEGDITFTLTVGARPSAPPTGEPATGPAPKPSATQRPPAVVSAVAVDPASDADDGVPVWPFVALGAGALAALAGGALAVRGRRRDNG
jgi:copper resistance protein C